MSSFRCSIFYQYLRCLDFILWEILIIFSESLSSHFWSSQDRQLSDGIIHDSSVIIMQVENITATIRKSALKQLSTYDWMDNDTKETAKMKVNYT